MFRTWRYLRLTQDWHRAELEPAMEQYASLCAAVASAAITEQQRCQEAQSALLDKLGEDGWELVASSGNPTVTEWLIFKRELPGPT